MHEFPDEAVPVASAAAGSPPDADVLEIRARAADAILRPVSFKKAKPASTRRAPPLFERLLRYGPHAALAACLFGFAWMAGSYFSSPVRTIMPQGSVESAEVGHAAQKMAEEIRALKANVEAMHTAQSLSAKDAAALGNLKTRLDAVKTETSAAIAEVAGKVEHLQRETAAKLSRSWRYSLPLQLAAARRQQRRSPGNGHKAGAVMPSIRPKIPPPRERLARLESLHRQRAQTSRRAKPRMDKEPINQEPACWFTTGWSHPGNPG